MLNNYKSAYIGKFKWTLELNMKFYLLNISHIYCFYRKNHLNEGVDAIITYINRVGSIGQWTALVWSSTIFSVLEYWMPVPWPLLQRTGVPYHLDIIAKLARLILIRKLTTLKTYSTFISLFWLFTSARKCI